MPSSGVVRNSGFVTLVLAQAARPIVPFAAVSLETMFMGFVHDPADVVVLTLRMLLSLSR